jgi:ubiquinone/menaquinone biosynthesis C-methylase UbiE
MREFDRNVICATAAICENERMPPRTPGDPWAEPTARFTDRVENYVKARPGYPAEMIPYLVRECALTRDRTVLDIGCGTGLLAERFCEFGCPVIGVEPNAAMREAGRQYLAGFPNFQMIEGTAESTSMPAASVDIVTAGQAFHWFEVEAARREFARVLKPRGWTVLVWNDRVATGAEFAEGYEKLVERFGIDYAQVDHRRKANDETFRRFFGNNAYRRAAFPNAQRLEWGRFLARVLSSSYMPAPGHPSHEPMMKELQRIFEENTRDSAVIMKYETAVIYGRITPPAPSASR